MVNNRMPGFLPATLALVILLLFVPPVAADEYNGNMGKWMHGESNITTQWTYEGHGNVMYSTHLRVRTKALAGPQEQRPGVRLICQSRPVPG